MNLWRGTANRPKSEEKSVQLAEVHLYQNPYFSVPYLGETSLFHWQMQGQFEFYFINSLKRIFIDKKNKIIYIFRNFQTFHISISTEKV